MNVRNVRFLALYGFLLLFLVSAGVTKAEAPHPNIGAAQKTLQETKALLESEPPVFGGHKEDAIEHIKKAIKDLQKAMEYDNKHNKDKKDDKKK